MAAVSLTWVTPCFLTSSTKLIFTLISEHNAGTAEKTKTHFNTSKCKDPWIACHYQDNVSGYRSHINTRCNWGPGVISHSPMCLSKTLTAQPFPHNLLLLRSTACTAGLGPVSRRPSRNCPRAS